MREYLTLPLAVLIVASSLVSIAAAQPPIVKPPLPITFDDSYLIPGLLDVLYKFDRILIPDQPLVRAYYMGIYKEFTKLCGEPSAYVSDKMLSYGFNEYRAAKRTPVGDMPRILADVLTGKTLQQGPSVLQEGIQDATMFTKRYGCQTPVFLHMRANLWWVGGMHYQNPPKEPPNDTRFFAMVSPAYRKIAGLPEPERRVVQWWTPYVGYWVGTSTNAQYGSRKILLMVVDPTDPSVNGVPSWLFVVDEKSKDTLYLGDPVQVSLTSKQGTFVFLTERKTADGTGEGVQVAATSQDGKRMIGTVTYLSRKGQQWSFEVTRE